MTIQLKRDSFEWPMLLTQVLMECLANLSQIETVQSEGLLPPTPGRWAPYDLHIELPPVEKPTLLLVCW